MRLYEIGWCLRAVRGSWQKT